MQRVELGKTYCDGPTGVEGVATARTESLGGSVEIKLEWADGDGVPASDWFTESRLTEVPQKRVGFTPEAV